MLHHTISPWYKPVTQAMALEMFKGNIALRDEQKLSDTQAQNSLDTLILNASDENRPERWIELNFLRKMAQPFDC